MMGKGLIVPAVVMLSLAACAEATAPEPAAAPPGEPVDEPVSEAPRIQLLVDATGVLHLPDGPAGSFPVAAGLFLTLPAAPGLPAIAPAVVADRARRLVEDANRILAQCRLQLVMEAVQAIAVPPDLGTVQGNERGSWGGHPPDSVGDPDLFMYYENERLTSDTREIFGYGKRHTSKNGIAIFVIEDIEYYIGEQRTPAGGLSFPPVIYHHVDDYPLRNSVLVRPIGRDPKGLPFASGFVVAHELGHMLLNTGDHVGEIGTLMIGGPLLTPEQCDRMHANRERLFGDDAVHDPGPPGGG